MFRLKDFPDDELEAVQTRKEQYHSDSRNPETAFGTLQEDAQRRDLTVNALYYNVSTHEMLDPTGGMADMERNVIRVTSTPDIVYQDDPLRILRAIRFYGQFNTGLKNPAYTWVIEKETFEGMKMHSNRLEIISKERIATELHKMLLTEYPSE
jgi:tRNA nucleotidyltransferase/poly(A) polymerase